MSLLIVIILACLQVLTKSFICRCGQYEGMTKQIRGSRWGCRSARKDGDTGSDDLQWALFKKHHIGSWKGLWTTYDEMGDKLLETAAVVENVQSVDDQASVQVTQRIIQESVSADCPSCFDSTVTKELNVAKYDTTLPGWPLKYRLKFGANGMVIGPKVLKTGIMATELALRFRSTRLRVIFQHAPVWEASSEKTGPPAGLQLYRLLVSRESLVGIPTLATQPEFFRNVAPYQWHKEWAGTSWTWGAQAGDRGWDVPSLIEEDDWHGSAPPEAWNLRLPGGIFVQSAPKIIQAASVGICRVAWLVPGENKEDAQQLLRLEVGVQALQEIAVQDDEVVGYAPPTLATYRCDVLKETGELRDAPSFIQMLQDEEREKIRYDDVDTVARPVQVKRRKKHEHEEEDNGISAIQDALQL